MAAAIRGLKSGKAAGENEIRPKMLKVLNGGVRCLTRVYQVVWKLGKTPENWQTAGIIPIYKVIVSSVEIIDEYYFLVFQERCMPSALK